MRLESSSFDKFFAELTAHPAGPHAWQRELAAQDECTNRLVRIPTGFGKTLGVFAAWAWNRVALGNPDWPRRLVWCLPMRVLVEQTESEVQKALQRLGMLQDPHSPEKGVGVHVLMGGADAGRWHLYPEADAVLIGTQDMLLSRAMNRGYACPRARWPMEFGLLNQDALWVMDEVQLMDVGLATSGQLQVFRYQDERANKSLRPCATWWMSATLQREWLSKSPDIKPLTDELPQSRIAADARRGPLWEGVSKHLETISCGSVTELAEEVAQRHEQQGFGREGPTLVVLNTVKRAVEAWEKLKENRTIKENSVDVRLVHSRFRPAERKSWGNEFLNRDACAPGTNRIIVATQVIEAGVDISARLLVTELAPWTSLVQRFGRCARWVRSTEAAATVGEVVVVNFKHDSDEKDEKDEKAKAAPYAPEELEAAGRECNKLEDVASLHLERFEDAHPELLPGLYPYEPRHLLLRHELDELFDTSPDLSGADINISRFIRSGAERDVQVFWADVGKEKPPSTMKPTRDELCSVPFLDAEQWLCGRGKSQKLKSGTRAWVWDWLDRSWRDAKRQDIYPGQTLMIDAKVGGYSPDKGWDPTLKRTVETLHQEVEQEYEERPCWQWKDGGVQAGARRVRKLPPEEHADAAEDDESLSILEGVWQTIAIHGLETGKLASRIAQAVAPDSASLLHLAGRWHDLGKAHPAFQTSIQAADRPERDDMAKAPDAAWPCSPSHMYRIDDKDRRCGFRHELASVLGLFGVLRRHEPNHQALLGPWRDLFRAMGEGENEDATEHSTSTAVAGPTPIEREILDLGADEFDLLAYLVCAHHGKVRMSWHASPADQEAAGTKLRIRGVCEGDVLPPTPLADVDGICHDLPGTALCLSPSVVGLSRDTGQSWTERVLRLIERHGPFALAWLESLLRAADQRASMQAKSDSLLQTTQPTEHADDRSRVERDDSTLAPVASGGAPTPPLGINPKSRSQIHGDGRRTSERGVASGKTRPPYAATRYIETTLGILSYQKLAPLLADKALVSDLAINRRDLADTPLSDLTQELHRRICAELTPDMAGRWRRKDVRVGAHSPPHYWHVPVLMHEFAADLAVRLNQPGQAPVARAIENLAFAEGRFLHIHPFEDFNGRVSRLFLRELLHRMEMPIVETATSTESERQRYFAALQAFDQQDPRPLAAFWRWRFSRGEA